MVSLLPEFLPDRAGIAESFDPRSKPSSFELDKRMVPEMIGLSVCPVIAKATESAPPCSFDQDGRTTPNAGGTSPNSSNDMLPPSIFILSAVASPATGTCRLGAL